MYFQCKSEHWKQFHGVLSGVNIGHENLSQMNTFGSVVYFLKKGKKNHSSTVPSYALSGRKINHFTSFLAILQKEQKGLGCYYYLHIVILFE